MVRSARTVGRGTMPGGRTSDLAITVYVKLAIRSYVSAVGASPTLDSWAEPPPMIIGGVMFVIEDERHAEPQGKYPTEQTGVCDPPGHVTPQRQVRVYESRELNARLRT